MLAERLATVLPRLEPDGAQEVTSIHSSGTLPPASPLVTEPPFGAPASHLDPGGRSWAAAAASCARVGGSSRLLATQPPRGCRHEHSASGACMSARRVVNGGGGVELPTFKLRHD